MLSGRLVWVRDHFAPAELAQLREDRELRAFAWIKAQCEKEKLPDTPSAMLLTVPEDSFAADMLLDVDADNVGAVSPPFSGAQISGRDAEGRYFVTSSPVGRAKILFNGVIEGIDLIPGIDNDKRVRLDAMHGYIEECVQRYRAVQREGLGMGDRAWVALTLFKASKLGAMHNPHGLSVVHYEQERLVEATLALPAIVVDHTNGATAVKDGINRIYKVLESAFGF